MVMLCNFGLAMPWPCKVAVLCLVGIQCMYCVSYCLVAVINIMAQNTLRNNLFCFIAPED